MPPPIKQMGPCSLMEDLVFGLIVGPSVCSAPSLVEAFSRRLATEIETHPLTIS